MSLVLLATAVWSIGLGTRRCLALRSAPQPTTGEDTLGEWVSALSLVGAGLWALQARSWSALFVGYLIGWTALWLLPVHREARSARRAA